MESKTLERILKLINGMPDFYGQAQLERCVEGSGHIAEFHGEATEDLQSSDPMTEAIEKAMDIMVLAPRYELAIEESCYSQTEIGLNSNGLGRDETRMRYYSVKVLA